MDQIRGQMKMGQSFRIEDVTRDLRQEIVVQIELCEVPVDVNCWKTLQTKGRKIELIRLVGLFATIQVVYDSLRVSDKNLAGYEGLE